MDNALMQTSLVTQFGSIRPITLTLLSSHFSIIKYAKQNNPASISVCFILPQCDGAWMPLLANMQLIKSYPVGTALFTQPVLPGNRRKLMQPLPWPVQVCYDPPELQCTVVSTDCLDMSFAVYTAGHSAISLLNTGAGCV